MKNIKIILLFAICTITISSFSQAKIIFDTDFGGDADDLGALAMLHQFIDQQECILLGIMCWSTEHYAVPAVDAVNTYYGHPQIPIGARKTESTYVEWNYNKPIADSFPHKLNQNNVPDATTLYRKILSESEDSSITIVTVGPLKNIENLINSHGDSISVLDGKSLVNRKVREFVIMGGQFPEGKKEWNFDGNMPGVTLFVIENIDVPIVFSGYEVGVDIKTGEIFNSIDKNSPLYIGFMHFSRNAPWIKMYFNGKILDNSTYDQTAVLYAVRNGVGIYWDKIEGGICVPDENGGNNWIEQANSTHSYLKLTMDKEEFAELIESIMLGEF